MLPAVTLPEFAISAVIIVTLTVLTLTLRKYAVLMYAAFFAVPVITHSVQPPHSVASLPDFALSSLLYWADLILRFLPQKVV